MKALEVSQYLSLCMGKQRFAFAKTKTQISFAVTAKLISAFVFDTRIVQFLLCLYPKFQDSSFLLWLYSLVCVGPGRKPKMLVFSCTGSSIIIGILFFTACHTYSSNDFSLSLLWLPVRTLFFILSWDLRSSMLVFKVCRDSFFLAISVSTFLIQAWHFSMESSTVSGSICLFDWKSDFCKLEQKTFICS